MDKDEREPDWHGIRDLLQSNWPDVNGAATRMLLEALVNLHDRLCKVEAHVEDAWFTHAMRD